MNPSFPFRKATLANFTSLETYIYFIIKLVRKNEQISVIFETIPFKTKSSFPKIFFQWPIHNTISKGFYQNGSIHVFFEDFLWMANQVFPFWLKFWIGQRENKPIVCLSKRLVIFMAKIEVNENGANDCYREKFLKHESSIFAETFRKF